MPEDSPGRADFAMPILRHADLGRDITDQILNKERQADPQALFEAGTDLLGSYLLHHFKDAAKGNVASFLAGLGPYLLTLRPQKQQSHVQQWGFFDAIDRGIWTLYLQTIDEDLKLQLDTTPENPQVPVKADIVPELAAAKGALIRTLRGGQLELDALALVMGLAPQYRPLAAVAVQEARKAGELPPYRAIGDAQGLAQDRQMILSCAPTLRQVWQVAKIYETGPVKDLLKDLGRVLYEYETVWK